MLDVRYWKVFQTLEKAIFSEIRLTMVLGHGEAGIMVLKNEDVYSIGSGELLGIEGVTSAQIPVKILQLSGQTVKGFYTGAKFALALTQTGQLFSWGSNKYGQLGLGESCQSSDVPMIINLPINDSPIEVACGGCHAIVLMESGKVYSWGWNGDMQVNARGSMTVWTPEDVLNEDGLGRSKVISVACGWSSSFALRDNGKVWAWGYNYLAKFAGSYIQPTALALGFSVQKIVCGEENVLVLDNQGRAHVWGFDGKNCKVQPTPVAEELGSVTDIAATWQSRLNVFQCQTGRIFLSGNWNGQHWEHPKPTKFASMDIVFAANQGIMCRPVVMAENNNAQVEWKLPLVSQSFPPEKPMGNSVPHKKLLELLIASKKEADLAMTDDIKALLTSMLTIQNALDVFQVAQKFQFEDLERQCLEVTAPPNFAKIVNSDAPGDLVKLLAFKLAQLDGFNFSATLAQPETSSRGNKNK